MSEATAEAVNVPDSPAELGPVFKALEPNAEHTCDRHPTTYALVEVTLPSGLELIFCGNCARVNFGYEHTRYSVPENKTKGSAHA